MTRNRQRDRSVHRLFCGLALLLLASCTKPSLPPAPQALTPVPPGTGEASVRENGSVGSIASLGRTSVSYGSGVAAASNQTAASGTSGAVTDGGASLNFADTDIRDVVAQILGGILHVNYTIDPAVHGTATLHTSVPISNDQLLPTLQVLLSQAGATLINNGPLYRIVPAGGANQPGLASAPGDGGGQVIPLHYASAEELARVLQPFVTQGTKLAADSGSNAIVVSGDPQSRDALVGLIAAFDVDSLAGQSLALFPVDEGNAKDVATALQQALGGSASSGSQTTSTRGGAPRVIPMERINAVLVAATEPRTIQEAQRVFAMMQQRQQNTVRSWTVYYLQNGHSNDVAYVLQQAFTPDHVTATPTPTAQLKSGSGSASGSSSGGITSIGQGGAGSDGVGGIGGGSLGGLGTTGGGLGSTTSSGAAASSANPLLGGLDASGGSSGSGASNANTMRIIPDSVNNSLLIYGTQQELDTVMATLRKIDIIPLQVRIDAVIAEVELNDALQYGTQFFFKSGGLNGTLSSVFNATNSFAGYFLAGSNASQVALSLLQAVSTVHVLSSPELMVLDNQPARLEVGDLVPYLTQQAQSTVTSTSDVINSVAYEQTGVILEVTPRVSSEGLVTLDISQEVSNVNTAASTTISTGGISSPTFTQRDVQSRVVVQDGQTIGLAGLIQDSVTKSNQGVPFLKDVPIIGSLFGQQSNSRTRNELLVLITPHVVHDQRDALALTQDLREQLPSAAAVPQYLQGLRPSGSDDPDARIRQWGGSQ
ncbi:type II secretion system secretin GspD [Acidisoma cladoniae]|uniref:type II secretion system secretin GspD n=1 Tax=Acidisoma cladoniae TaxID=3040935 RepID=UPI0025506299|nr:type II secretion system secretin GspD [Acidisoma sp. PAMC 29798]